MKLLIVGCGRVGAGLARTLAIRGHEITVVDNDPEAFARLGASFKGRQLVGFGLDQDVLLDAGIRDAAGLAAVTGRDELNVVVARAARHVFHVPRVVARLYDPAKAETYRQLGIMTISPVAWGINRLTESLIFPDLEVVASLGSGDVDLVEVEVNPRLEGRVIRDVIVPGQIHIVALKRGERFQLPSLGSVLAAHDVLCLAIVPGAAEHLRALLGLI